MPNGTKSKQSSNKRKRRKKTIEIDEEWEFANLITDAIVGHPSRSRSRNPPRQCTLNIKSLRDEHVLDRIDLTRISPPPPPSKPKAIWYRASSPHKKIFPLPPPLPQSFAVFQSFLPPVLVDLSRGGDLPNPLQFPSEESEDVETQSGPPQAPVEQPREPPKTIHITIDDDDDDDEYLRSPERIKAEERSQKLHKIFVMYEELAPEQGWKQADLHKFLLQGTIRADD